MRHDEADEPDEPHDAHDRPDHERAREHRAPLERAHAHGIGIYGATLTPYEGTVFHGFYQPEGEVKREAVNAWIRSPGAFDAVIDFDAGSLVLTTFGRSNSGTVRGDADLADRFLNLFYRI